MKLHETHSVTCNATKERVYNIICESERWPEIFEPCIAVKVLHKTDFDEHIEITAWVNGKEMTWESQRFFLKDIYAINSKILKPIKLVKSMDTHWRVISLNNTQSLIILEHNYEIDENISDQVEGVNSISDAITFISNAINHNTSIELNNIKNLFPQKYTNKKIIVQKSTSHSILCNVTAEKIYEIIADVSYWPKIFSQCVSANVLEKFENTEIIRIEAMQNNNLISWNTKREYLKNIFRIDFSLPIPMPYLKSMKGQWRVIPIDTEKCLLNVERHFELLEMVPNIREDIKTLEQASNFISQFIEENAENEMLAIKLYVEKGDDTFCMFKTRYFLPFEKDEVYDFFVNVIDWPKKLPHCNSIEIIYDDSENQEFVMEVKTQYGDEYFRSIRTCNRDTYTISYFQPSPPPVLKTHTGSWEIHSTEDGTKVISLHTIRINSVICAKLFNDTNLTMNKQRVKELILNNSKITIEACKQWLTNKQEIVYA